MPPLKRWRLPPVGLPLQHCRLPLVGPPLKRRRLLLIGLIGSGLAACVRPAERQDPARLAATTDETAAWQSQALAVLADTLGALRTCDAYAAYRASASARASTDPVWDPPTSAEWASAQQQASGLRQRADQLFQTIANSRIDPSVWRERRAMAAGAHELVDAADALRAYLERANHFAPDGDGSGGLEFLKTAWSRWDAAAQAWGRDRTEPIACS